MVIDTLVDYRQLERYRKKVYNEQLTDLFLPNPSSGIRIVANTVGSTIIGCLWANGFRKLYKVGPGFRLKMFGFLSLYALSYNISREFSIGYLRNNFNISNVGLPNLTAALMCTSLFLPIHMRGLLEIPNLYFKIGLHFFVVNLYWDLWMTYHRNFMLNKPQVNQALKEFGKSP